MNNIISKVTPLTKSIIWLTDDILKIGSEQYKAIDYLLNGLLTSSLNANSESDIKGRVIVSSNFGQPLYIYITKEIVNSEYQSFLTLLSKNMNQENTIMVIDESDSYQTLLNQSSADIRPRFQLLK